MGRAASLVVTSLAEVSPENQKWTTQINSSALGDGEAIRLLAPQRFQDFSDWLVQRKADPAAKKATKSKKKSAPFPETVFDALQLDNADWKNAGWNLPPGSHWIQYLRPRDYLRIAPSSRTRRARLSDPPRVARFALTSAVQPSITQALSLGERFHRALCSSLRDGEASPMLTGLDADGRPLKGNEHAYFLPESDDQGRVTHVTVHAPAGFDDAACRALSRLRKVWGAEGFDVEIVLLATGQPTDFALASPYFQMAKVWESLTPFVPARHAKASRAGVPKIDPNDGLQIGSAEHDCRRLLGLVDPTLSVLNLRSLGPPDPIWLPRHPVSGFPTPQAGPGEGTRATTSGTALRVEFDNPVSMPFGLGYGAHFGLGVFVPVASGAGKS